MDNSTDCTIEDDLQLVYRPGRKRTSEDAKHSGNDHPQILSAPNFSK